MKFVVFHFLEQDSGQNRAEIKLIYNIKKYRRLAPYAIVYYPILVHDRTILKKSSASIKLVITVKISYDYFALIHRVINN